MYKYQTIFIPHSTVTSYSLGTGPHVAVIGGGMSAEREVSLVSSSGVLKAVADNGYQTTFIDMGADIAEVLASIKPDVVFNCLHGTYGEDGCLPGLLNIMNIPYTHSGLLASAIAFCKIKSKELFINNNIKTAPFIVIHKTDNLQTDPMPRPYVIKPLTQGSSIGVELIFPEDDFDFANYDFPYGDKVIVEQYIKGREMQVAVLNGKALGALEIKLLRRRFYDYDTKYTDGFAEHLMPAPLSENNYKKLLELSEQAFNIIGCRGLARVEFIYSETENEFYILEINTHPGMTPLSICPEIAAYQGINFKNLIKQLIESACLDESNTSSTSILNKTAPVNGQESSLKKVS